MLVLPFGGMSLVTWETERRGGKCTENTTVSESERYVFSFIICSTCHLTQLPSQAFINVLQNIHGG